LLYCAGAIDSLVTRDELVHLVDVSFVTVVAFGATESVLAASSREHISKPHHRILPGTVAVHADFGTALFGVLFLTQARADIGLGAVAAGVLAPLPSPGAVNTLNATGICLEINNFVLENRAKLCARKGVGHYLAQRGLAVESRPSFGACAHVRGRAIATIGAAITSLSSRGLGQIGAERVIEALYAHRDGAIAASPPSHARRGLGIDRCEK